MEFLKNTQELSPIKIKPHLSFSLYRKFFPYSHPPNKSMSKNIKAIPFQRSFHYDTSISLTLNSSQVTTHICFPELEAPHTALSSFLRSTKDHLH